MRSQTSMLAVLLAPALGCQPAADPLALPVASGDLVMIALSPFPQEISNSAPSVSLYRLEAGEPLRWTFVESRNREVDRLSSVSNHWGALVISTSTRAADLVVWRAPFADFQYNPLEHDAIVRVRGDLVPELGYRCRISNQICLGDGRGKIGPAPGDSCLLSAFGEANHYQREGDAWHKLDPPNLKDYAIEFRYLGDAECKLGRSVWDF